MSKLILAALPAVAFLALAVLDLAEHRPPLVVACFFGVAFLFLIVAISRWRHSE